MVFLYLVLFVFPEHIREYPEKPPTCYKSLKTLSHNVVSSTPNLSGNRTHNISGDRH